MGKLSMSLALVALLAVAGTYAARPIDVSNEESIKPMNTLEEQAVSDSSRELLNSHMYPPPPPAGSQQDDTDPHLEQTITVSFNETSGADNFTSDFGGPHFLLRNSLDYVADALNGPQKFGMEYLQSALAGSNSDTAVSGSISASQSGADVTIMLKVFYNVDSIDETTRSNEASAIIGSIFSDTTGPNPFNPSARKLSAVTGPLYDNAGPGAYGASTPYDGGDGSFKNMAEKPESFVVGTEDDGAQGLKASLFMGVVVILSAFLLA